MTLESVRGSFFTPWGQVGGQFFLCPYSRRKIGGSRRGYLRISGGASCQEKKQVCVRTSSETQQLVKEMRPLNSCHLLFKLAVEQDMVMNVLAAGMELPNEQFHAMRGRCVQDVKKPAAVSRWVTLSAIRGIVCDHPYPVQILRCKTKNKSPRKK